jgi:heme exporter protein A
MRLVVNDLSAERGGRRVFEAVSFALGRGGALVVTGANGAGKSTLLRVLAGHVRAADGTITLEGGDPERTVGEQAHHVGHADALKPALTVHENLAFWAAFTAGRAGSVEAALDAFDLADLAGLPARVLSAGQRRRLALARLLASHRPIWLLDEPTTAIDAASERAPGRVVAAHRAEGGLVIAATHAPLGLADAAGLHLGVAP